jgi:hypothetical protein
MKFHVWGLGLPRGHFGISLSRTHTLQFKTRGFEREPQMSKAPKNNPPTYLPRPLPDGHLIEIASGKRGQFWGPGEGQKAFISCCHQPQTGEPCLHLVPGRHAHRPGKSCAGGERRGPQGRASARLQAGRPEGAAPGGRRSKQRAQGLAPGSTQKREVFFASRGWVPQLLPAQLEVQVAPAGPAGARGGARDRSGGCQCLPASFFNCAP